MSDDLGALTREEILPNTSRLTALSPPPIDNAAPLEAHRGNDKQGSPGWLSLLLGTHNISLIGNYNVCLYRVCRYVRVGKVLRFGKKSSHTLSKEEEPPLQLSEGRRGTNSTFQWASGQFTATGGDWRGVRGDR